MPDFREELYKRYVGSGQSSVARMSPAGLELYGRWCRHTYGPILQPIDRAAPVLELGCGPGFLLHYLRQEGFHDLQGIDISHQQVALARARGLRVAAADARDVLARAPGHFGLIVAVDFFEHFTKDEIVILLPLVRAALRPGGWLLIQTINGAGLFPGQVTYGDFTHVTVLAPGSLRQLLTVYGFTEPRFFETGPAPIGLRGRLDTLLWQAIRVAANTLRRIETGKTQSVWTENLICLTRRPEP